MKNSISKHNSPKPNGAGRFNLEILENGMPKFNHDFTGILFSQRFIAGLDYGLGYVLTIRANDGKPDFSTGKRDVGPTAPCGSQLVLDVDKFRFDLYADSGAVDFKVVSATEIKGSYSCQYSHNGVNYEAKGEFDIHPDNDTNNRRV